MDLVDSEPATGVQQELSRFGRVLDSFSRRIQAVERRLTHTEGCQQAQELEIHEMKHVVDKVLYSETGLSFWGGVSPKSGIIVDQRHPLSGLSLHGKILAIPAGRGSCTGSQVILELLLNGNAPAAIVLCHTDEIIALGAIVAEELCNKKLPVLCLEESAFKAMSTWRTATIDGSVLSREGQGASSASKEEEEEEEELQLSTSDQQMLSGSQGLARQKALSIVARMARLQGAAALIDVKQAHIDGCTYIGPASLKFAQKLLEWDAKVQVPTTLNAISVDLARRSEFPEELGGPAASLAEAGLRSAPGVCKFVAYLKIGARGSFTCAPYLLDSAPEKGDHIGWGESNAVVFANSVLGARTQKYADFLDACVAITGRAPLAGCHLERAAQVVLQVKIDASCVDDAFYPTLGYLCGLKAPRLIPAILGLENLHPTRDDLKAFSAAFGTSSSAPMFHIAPDLQSVLHDKDAEVIDLTQEDLMAVWQDLDADGSCDAVESCLVGVVDLVALGNPHFSLEEHSRMAELCQGRKKHPDVTVVVTSGPQVLAQSRSLGFGEQLEAFGAQLVSDTCWCMLGEVVPAPTSVLPPESRTLITNSAKYAHYAPGLVNRHVRFGSLATCIEAACNRVVPKTRPPWLGLQARRLSTLTSGYKALSGVSKQEVLAKEAELSEGLVQLREQVRALIDFLAQAHVGARGFTGSDMEDKKEGVEHPAENLPSDGPRIAWQNAQSDANQRLRRVFSPPSFIPEPEKPTESKETKGADDSQGQKSSKSVRVCPPAPSESDGTEKTTPQAAETMRASRASAPPASAQRSVSCGGGAPGVGPAYHSLGSRPCVRVLSGQISPAPPHLNGASTPAPTGPTPKAVALSGPYFSGPGMVPMRCRTLSGGCRAFPESPNGWVFVF
eukprot:s4336_g6.t2